MSSSDSCKTCTSRQFSPPCSLHVNCFQGRGALRRYDPLDCSLCRELLNRRDAQAVAYLQHFYVLARKRLRSCKVSSEEADDFFLSDEHKRAAIAAAPYPRNGRPKSSSSSSKRSASRSAERQADAAPRSREGKRPAAGTSSTSGGINQPSLPRRVAASQQGQLTCLIFFIFWLYLHLWSTCPERQVFHYSYLPFRRSDQGHHRA